MTLILLTAVIAMLSVDPTLTQTVSIISPPTNSTSLRGSSVLFDCGINGPYVGFFEWKAYKDATGVTGQQIYSSPPYTPNSKCPPTKFIKVGEFGLNVSSLDWTDGALYSCSFLTGDVHATASLVVIDNIELSTSPATAVIANTTVELKCTATFGAPEFSADSLTNNELFPHLDMFVGSKDVSTPTDDNDATFNASAVSMRYDPGKPGTKIHTLTKTVNYVVSMADVDQQLTCTVSTRLHTAHTAQGVYIQHAFTYSTNITLNIQAPAHDVTIAILQPVYTVGDVINCSAQGWPLPNYKWKQVFGPATVVDQLLGPSLTITETMVGQNVWKCIAHTDAIVGSVPAELEISFNVSAAVVKIRADSTNGGGKTVGLAVGLVFGFLAIIAIAAAIVFLYIRRRNQQTKPAQKKDAPYVYSSVNPKAEAFKPRPIYTPPQQLAVSAHDTSTDPTTNLLDRSGYGDLGLSFNHQDSTAAPRTASVSDPINHQPGRQTSTADRPSATWLPPQWQDTSLPSNHYSNVPPQHQPPPLTAGSRSTSNSAGLDQPALGFADLGFGGAMRASQSSINRAAAAVDNCTSDRPTGGSQRQAMRASNRSLNRSTDSGARQPTVEGNTRPPPRVNGVRGSNPLLNRSDDTAARLAGASETSRESPAVSEVDSASSAGRGRMAAKPPKPPKKPDVVQETPAVKPDDLGTIV